MGLVFTIFVALFLVGGMAVFLRISGRALAATRIQWSQCFTYAVIVLFALIPIGAFGASLAPSTAWIAASFGLAVQALVGAFYLGSRVKKASGSDLGPITGAKVGAGAAFISVLVGLGLAAVLRLFDGISPSVLVAPRAASTADNWVLVDAPKTGDSLHLAEVERTNDVVRYREKMSFARPRTLANGTQLSTLISDYYIRCKDRTIALIGNEAMSPSGQATVAKASLPVAFTAIPVAGRSPDTIAFDHLCGASPKTR